MNTLLNWIASTKIWLQPSAADMKIRSSDISLPYQLQTAQSHWGASLGCIGLQYWANDDANQISANNFVPFIIISMIIFIICPYSHYSYYSNSALIRWSKWQFVRNIHVNTFKNRQPTRNWNVSCPKEWIEIHFAFRFFNIFNIFFLVTKDSDAIIMKSRINRGNAGAAFLLTIVDKYRNFRESKSFVNLNLMKIANLNNNLKTFLFLCVVTAILICYWTWSAWEGATTSIACSLCKSRNSVRTLKETLISTEQVAFY